MLNNTNFGFDFLALSFDLILENENSSLNEYNMTKINLKILGAGCTKCKTLEEFVIEVVRENGFDANIQKNGDIVQIMSY